MFTEYELKKLFELATSQTKYNKEGLAIIEKDDPWAEESEWDEIYKEESKCLQKIMNEKYLKPLNI